MEKELSRTDAQDLADYKQAASVEAGLRREFMAKADKYEEALKHIVHRCGLESIGGIIAQNALDGVDG